jgi:hypothetical protein
VPEELRAGYRILRNAGYIPPELEMRREAVEIALQLASLDDSPGTRDQPVLRASLLDRLNRINLMLAETGKSRLVIPLEYIHKLAGKV